MTSSSRHLKENQPFWNYEIQKYKDYDPFYEPGLISILLLACGRPGLTKATLESTWRAISQYTGEIEWLFGEQGSNKENKILFDNFICERKICIYPNKNYGINNLFNSLFRISRGEYCLILENDWANIDSCFNFLQIAKDILDENKDVGIVNLRDIYDPWENNGYGKPDYLPYSCKHLKVGQNISHRNTIRGNMFFVANKYYAWNNNPNLVRKKIYFDCGCYPEPLLGTDLRHGETVFQERVLQQGWLGSHIGQPVYRHIGGALAQEYV